MQWSAGLSTALDFETAVDEACTAVVAGLAGEEPNLTAVFVSPGYRQHFVRLHRMVLDRFPETHLVGCSGDSIVGDGVEIESGPALCVVGGFLPNVEIQTFHLRPEDVPIPGTPEDAWREALRIPSGAQPQFVVLPDPYSVPVATFLQGMDAAFETSTIVGGVLSGAPGPGQGVLYSGREAYGTGVTGVALWGNVEIDAVVAQGCRPIGSPLFVTSGKGNVIRELDGRRPAVVVQELFESLPASDQELMRHSLFIGVVMTPSQDQYRQGDFLVRNIIGLDPKSGALGVAADMNTNDVVQLHLRDARTSVADLSTLLSAYAEHHQTQPNALMFSCLGRGKGLYGEPNVDSNIIAEALGRGPLGGFFGNGEIGPVQKHTQLHGYTCALGLVRPKHVY